MDDHSVLTMPHNFEAEQAVLGAIILNNALLNELDSILTPNSFHAENHRHIFRAMLEISEKKEPIDEIILGEQLQEYGKLEDVGSYSYLAELVECVPTSGNMVYYAKIIKEDSILRDLITTTSDVSRKARDPQQNTKDLINEAIEKITSFQVEDSKAEHIKDILMRNFDKLEEISKSKSIITGIPTGYSDVDKMLHGLQPTDLIIIAARPSMGKTALGLNIASYVATRTDTRGAVLFFSMEMSKEQIGMRLLISESMIENNKFHSGNLVQDDWDKLAMATDRISVAPLIIDDRSNLSPQEVVSTIKYYDKTLENGVSLVVLDYLQLMHGSYRDSREQQIASITRALKGTAKEMNIPVIALSQLNRALENRGNKRPQLSDLRESGSIEQDADVIIFIYREDVYKIKEDVNYKPTGKAEIIIEKHRNGPTGTVELIFAGKYTKFASPSKLEPPTYSEPKFVKY
jgi:replicative DNA helicase